MERWNISRKVRKRWHSEFRKRWNVLVGVVDAGIFPSKGGNV